MIGFHRRPWLIFSDGFHMERCLYERRNFVLFFCLTGQFDSLLCRISACVPTDFCAVLHLDAASPLMYICGHRVAAFLYGQGSECLLCYALCCNSCEGGGEVVLALLVIFVTVSVAHSKGSVFWSQEILQIETRPSAFPPVPAPPPLPLSPLPKYLSRGFKRCDKCHYKISATDPHTECLSYLAQNNPMFSCTQCLSLSWKAYTNNHDFVHRPSHWAW